MRWRGRVAVVLIAGLVASACSGSSDGPSTAATSASVRVVSQNILHGIACPADSNRCELPARVALFVRQLDEAGCPELVGMQETNEAVIAALRDTLPTACDGRYEIVSDDDPALDRELVLTTGTVIDSRRVRLAGPLRTAFLARVATEVGLVDFITTHLASSSDDRPCDATTCPPPCRTDDTLNTCQAREVAAFAAESTDPNAVTVIAGDLNAKVDEPTNDVLRDAGFLDTHLAAGNDECDPTSGAQCTSGRADAALTDLTDPSSKQNERIDFVYVGGARSCRAVKPTGLFNATPATDDPGGLAFPSDHTGVQATLRCPTSAADREAAATATSAPTTTSTTTASSEIDADTAAAITGAFTTLFGGEVTDVEQKLAALERGEELRTSFLQSYEATKDVASRISVRIDDMSRVDGTHASVTYSLLLDGTPVLDHLPGEAVLVGGRWLVSTRTYCEVSTQGATQIPAPCRANG
ncbi:MAG: endonuclease/exonuclease/phosphatase family protein [Microthrixaceae bacterium]